MDGHSRHRRLHHPVCRRAAEPEPRIELGAGLTVFTIVIGLLLTLNDEKSDIAGEYIIIFLAFNLVNFAFAIVATARNGLDVNRRDVALARMTSVLAKGRAEAAAAGGDKEAGDESRRSAAARLLGGASALPIALRMQPTEARGVFDV